MKKLVITLIVLLSVSIYAHAEVPEKVADSKHLSDLMELIVEVSFDLESDFHYSEKFWYEGNIRECDIVTGGDVIRFFDYNVMPLVMDYSDTGDIDVEKAMSDFHEILGKGEYYECRDSKSVMYYDIEYTYFIAKDKKYRIMFELASEN